MPEDDYHLVMLEKSGLNCRRLVSVSSKSLRMNSCFGSRNRDYSGEPSAPWCRTVLKTLGKPPGYEAAGLACDEDLPEEKLVRAGMYYLSLKSHRSRKMQLSTKRSMPKNWRFAEHLVRVGWMSPH